MLPTVPLAACLEAWATPETIDDFYSPALGRRGPATKTVRFATFPRCVRRAHAAFRFVSLRCVALRCVALRFVSL